MENTRDVKNEIENKKTGKVTAVVAVMSVFKKLKGSLCSTTKKNSDLVLKSKVLAAKRTKVELKSAKIQLAWTISSS